MPDIQALIRYINERQIKENGGSGYSFVRELPPTIRDTFFALACLKMLEADSQDGKLRWIYHGDEQQRPCAVPNTPLICYFKGELYGMYGSSIFSSSLSAVLKCIELGADNIGNGLVNSTLALLDMSSRQDIMSTYMALEILNAMEKRGYPITLSSSHIDLISDFLKRCTTRKGYVANPTASSVTLESTFAGHRIAQYLKFPDPLGIASFIDSLQNANGGFRRSQFGGISTLESCYLALSTISDVPSEEHDRMQLQM